MRRYLVKFKEELYNGQRLTFMERPDLQRVVDADTPRAARAATKEYLESVNLEMVSCGFARNRELRVLVRTPADGQQPSPILYRPNPQKLRLTGAGRIR